jgi:hypothetical protein
LEISNDIVYPTGDNLAFPDGTIIKGQGSTVYIIENGLKRGFSSADKFFALGYSFDAVVQVTDAELSLNPTGEDL